MMAQQEAAADSIEQELDARDRLVILENVPVVGPAKLAKLKSALLKLASNFGNIPDANLVLPLDGEQSRGCALLLFEKAQQAQAAAKKLQGFQMDKSHALQSFLFKDFENALNATDEPKAADAQSVKVRTTPAELGGWLLNENCYDQFVLRHDIHTEVYWNTRDQPELVQARENWSESYVSWSPKGTYLATFHRQGIVLWGKSKMEKQIRMVHANVKMIDWSPNEKYLVTCNKDMGELFGHSTSEEEPIILWDILRGEKIRSFAGNIFTSSAYTIKPGHSIATWPLLKWSAKSDFLGRIGENALLLYSECDNFKLFNKKAIKVDKIRDLQFSPNIEESHLVSFWVPETNDHPCRVTIYDYLAQKDKAVKNLFNVVDCRMFWQSSGDYLLVKVERTLAKSMKQRNVGVGGLSSQPGAAMGSPVYTNLEVFRLREKGVPVDVIEIKDNISHVAWEPRGQMFACIMTPSTTGMGHNLALIPNAQAISGITSSGVVAGATIASIGNTSSPNMSTQIGPTAIAENAVSVADLNTSNNIAHQVSSLSRLVASFAVVIIFKVEIGKVVLLKVMEKRNANTLLWSPQGRFLIIGSVKSVVPFIDFYDCKTMQCMASQEHPFATNLEWDPTGRYLCSFVSYWHHAMENGFWLWSFQGRHLLKRNLDKFYGFFWRPRPAMLLDEEQLKTIKSNLKQYNTKFDLQDALELNKVSNDVLEKRKKLTTAYETFKKTRIAQLERESDLRSRLRPSNERARQIVEYDEVSEVLLEEQTEVVQ